MKIPFKALLAAGCLAFSAGKASAGLLFSSWLDGAQEGLDSVNAKGVLGIMLNDAMDSAKVYAAFTNLTGPITDAHFHAGARGATGLPVLDIEPWLSGNSISADWGPIAKPVLDSLLRGLYYVNIHTAAHPNGEIRGQIELDRDLQFIADIQGANEVPPAATGAQGTGYFQLSPDDSILSAWVVYSMPDSSENDTMTLAHFHIGGPTVNGPVAIDLSGDTLGGTIMAKKPLTAPLNGVTAVRFLDSLKNGKVYINFHSRKQPNGLMRGQLTPSGDLVFPALLGGSGGAGKGLAIAWLSADNKRLMVRAMYSELTGQVTSARIRKGNSNSLSFPDAAFSSSSIDADVALDSISGGFDAGQFIQDLLDGALSLNVNASGGPSGGIHGSMKLPFRIGSAFRLDGSQEVPPVTTSAFGAGVVSMDREGGGLRYMVVADSLDSAFTTAHFHKQVPGAAGPVVKDLTPEFEINADSLTGLYLQGSWTGVSGSAPFTQALAAAMLADSLYINIHTARHPAGAIRGQIGGILGSAVSIFGRIPKARPGHARLVPLAGGAGLRFQGEPGRSLRIRIASVTGRVFADKRLALDASGKSGTLDLKELRQGMYVATWEERGVRYGAKFMRQ